MFVYQPWIWTVIHPKVRSAVWAESMYVICFFTTNRMGIPIPKTRYLEFQASTPHLVGSTGFNLFLVASTWWNYYGSYAICIIWWICIVFCKRGGRDTSKWYYYLTMIGHIWQNYLETIQWKLYLNRYMPSNNHLFRSIFE